MENQENQKFYIGDILFGAMFLVIGILICIISLSQYDLMDEYSLGAGFFPLIVGIALIVLSAVTLALALKGKFSEDTVNYPQKAGRVRIVKFLIMTAVLVLLFEMLGMIISFVLFIFFEMSFVEKQPFKYSALTALITTAAIYGLFVLLFKVKVPTGIFGL